MRRTKISAKGVQRWIGVTASSTQINAELLEKALLRFARWDYPVRVDDTIYEQFRYLAGSDSVRASALVRLLRDPSVGTVWCARGGYGATRILSLLDRMGAPALMKRDPRLLLGYSDVTALHLYFYHHLRLPSVHCQMPATMAWQKMTSSAERVLKGILAGRMPVGRASHTAGWKLRSLAGGSAEGVIVGGNLSLIASMVGSPWQANLNGALLFIEDCAEAPYRVDRMLTQLANAGIFKGLRGVLLGDFEADVVYREPAEKRYFREIFLERFGALGIPVLSGLPCGHGRRNEPLPLGVRAEITSRGRLLLLEQPVSGK